MCACTLELDAFDHKQAWSCQLSEHGKPPNLLYLKLRAACAYATGSLTLLLAISCSSSCYQRHDAATIAKSEPSLPSYKLARDEKFAAIRCAGPGAPNS